MKKYTNVPEFLADLDPTRREQVELLRSIIGTAHPAVSEHIKWNAPSYVLDGEDRVTFNLLNKENVVKLVLHMGATRKEDKKGTPVLGDDKGIVVWQSDIRGAMSFKNLEDIKANQHNIADVISRWLKIR